MVQKQICINLSKIHNWDEDFQLIQLDLDVYSKESQHLITRKHVSAHTENNYLNLNIKLKIRYPQNQNKIIIRIKQTNGDLQDFGEVQIDLDQLIYQKIKYLSFGRFKKILQIQTGLKNKQKSNIYNQRMGELSIEQKRIKNKQFIQDRKKFLQNYMQKQNELKNQFQQKIARILSQQHQRQMHRKRVTNLSRKTNMDQQQQMQSFIARSQINKKNTYESYKARSAFHGNTKDSNIQQIQMQHRRKSPALVAHSPRKHKLILNTLNIVSKQDKN